MERLDLRLLRKLGACDEAVAVYENRQEEDPVIAIGLLIDGCDELVEVTEQERLQWATWLIPKLLSDKDRVRYAIFAAEQVVEIFEKKYPDDKRPREAIEAAQNYVAGESSGASADASYAASADAASADAADASCAASAYASASYASADASYAAASAYAASAAASAAAYAAYASAASSYAASAAYASYASYAADASYASDAAYADDAAYAAYADGNDILVRILRHGIELLNRTS